MRPIPRSSFGGGTLAAPRRAAQHPATLAMRRFSGATGGAAASVVTLAARNSDSSSAAPPSHARLSGTWSVHERHDVDGVMELWGLASIARATAKRIGGLEICVSDPSTTTTAPHVAVRYLCPVPQFSVREVIPLGSPAVRLRRRDLKPGPCSGIARVRSGGGEGSGDESGSGSSNGGTARLEVATEWEGCSMVEEYSLVHGQEDTLVLRTTLRCHRQKEEGPREARAVQIYKRRF